MADGVLERWPDILSDFVCLYNGAEVFRSAEMPAGAPLWDTTPTARESSNGLFPVYALPVLSLALLAFNLLDTHR